MSPADGRSFLRSETRVGEALPGPGRPGAGPSVLGCGDWDLGATGAGVARHQAVGEETAPVGMVLARAGATGCLFRAVRDGAVAVHDQLSETAPHRCPPHRR